MTVNELRGGLITRYVDHWDSWQLAPEDITGSGSPVTELDLLSATGPYVSVSVARQTAPVHANGEPRLAQSCEFSPSTKSPASDGLIDFVSKFHGALAKGDHAQVLNMMTEDCVFIHPLVHRGPPGYRPFHADTTMIGKPSIGRFLRAVLPLLPDGENSRVTRVIGSLIGGGYQSQSGGMYANQGLSRDGIFSATALDFAPNGMISRMSTSFDTFHITRPQRQAIESALASAC